MLKLLPRIPASQSPTLPTIHAWQDATADIAWHCALMDALASRPPLPVGQGLPLGR